MVDVAPCTATHVADPLDALAPWERTLVRQAREARRQAAAKRQARGLYVEYGPDQCQRLMNTFPAGIGGAGESAV